MSDEPRGEHHLDIPLGTVVTKSDARGGRYVFVGWRVNTVGREALFVRDQTGVVDSRPPWTYHAAYLATLLREFPELAAYRA